MTADESTREERLLTALKAGDAFYDALDVLRSEDEQLVDAGFAKVYLQEVVAEWLGAVEEWCEEHGIAYDDEDGP